MLALLRQQIERALEDPSGAADELRRAVHTLKGASRGPAIPSSKRSVTKLETREPGSLRASGALTSDNSRAARDAVTTVTKFAPIVHGRRPSSRRRRSRFAPSLAMSRRPPLPRPSPLETSVSTRLRWGDCSSPPEDLVLDGSRPRPIEAVARARDDGPRARARGSFEARRRPRGAHGLAGRDRAAATPRAIRRRGAHDRGGYGGAIDVRGEAWRASSERAKLVASAARSLRQERFESLATSATQAAEDAAGASGVKLTVVREGRCPLRSAPPRVFREVLLHLVRNAVAHGFAGLRGGTLRIRAEEARASCG